ncbi:TPA: hypothetical protein ACTXXA_001063 [Legionella anisa]
MATSSAVLQSFLRDAFKDDKNLADLSVEDLLQHNRAECGLIQLDSQNYPLPTTFDDLPKFRNDKENNDVVFLYEGTLYYAEKNKNVRELTPPQKPDKPQEPPEPVDFEESDELEQLKSKKKRTDPEYLVYLEEYAQYESAYSEYIKQIKVYTSLKKSCSKTYKRARGEELDNIRKLTDRAYTEHRINDFLPSLNFYLGILGTTDRAMFPYIEKIPEKKEELIFNLRITLLLLLAQKKHEIEYQKIENIKVYNQHIKQCTEFLNALNPEYQKLIAQSPEQNELSDENPIKYMGIPLGQLLAQDMVDLYHVTEYDLGLISDAEREKYKIYLEASDNVLKYEFIGSEDKLIKGSISWDRLPKDLHATFPKDESKLPQFQTLWGLTILDSIYQKDLPWGKTKFIKEYMGKINEGRLYWVWGSTFLKTVVGQLPDYMYSTQGPEAMKTPDPYTGNLSWILYYARFFLELGLLLKHTIKGSWMSEEEAKTPAGERFLTQLSQRKFALLNDFLWGTANLLCFFKLNGAGSLGTAGDVLTLVLLVFDIAMAAWELEEQRIKYNKAMLQYDEDLERLGKQLQVFKDIEEKRELDDEEAKAKRQIEVQIRTLEREKLKCYRDWQLQKVSLINNIAYAVGLMLAFIVLTAPFMPISAPVLGIMLIAGAAACLAFTIINNAVKGGIELYKTYKTRQEHKQDRDEKIIELMRLLKKNKNLNYDEKKLLYLEIKQLQAETEYQKQMMIYQSVNLARRIMVEAIVPVVVLLSIVAIPLGGLGIIPVLIAAIALAIATQMLVDALFKPEEKKALEFDEEAYEAFCNKLEEPKLERDRLFSGDGKERSSDNGSTDPTLVLDY